MVRDQGFAPDTEMFLDKLPSQSSGGSLGFAKPNTKVGGVRFVLPRMPMCKCYPWQPQGSAHQAPLFMDFSRQEYCSGWPFPSPGDLPNSRVKLQSLTLQADSLPSEPSGKA